jgi:hypothetical protein
VIFDKIHINELTKTAKKFEVNFDNLTAGAQHALIDMEFNMGGKINKFKK